MNVLRRAIPPARRQLRTSVLRQQRGAAHSAHDAHHHAPVKESFGTGFYVVLAMLPASYALYKLSAPDDGATPWLTKWIDTYSDWKRDWLERNDLHTRLVQRAADDRNFFFSSTSPRHVELRFPEAFNMGSPYNVSAGSVVNVDKVIAHYEKKNYEEQAKKLQALKDGTLNAEQEQTRKEQS